MKSHALFLLSLVSVGCSEYQFDHHSKPIESGDTDPFVDSGKPVDTSPPGEECVDPALPGYITSTDALCENEVATGTFTPVIKWEKATWSVGNADQVMSTPIVASVTDDNGDGVITPDDVPDIILVTFSESNWSAGGVLRAISGDDGHEIFNVTNAAVQGTGGVAAGDIDGDGIVELISLAPDSVKAFEHDGTPKWTSQSIAGHIYGTSDVPAIADLDADGTPEIIAGRAILNNQGVIVGRGAYGYGGVAMQNVGSCPLAADVDLDGQLEVVVGNAIYTKTGTAKWYNGQTDGYPAVADFDGDGYAEIVVSGSGQIRLQETDGTVQWTQPIPGANSAYYAGPPTVADYDGDGQPEIGVASGSRYSVFKANGSILWQKTTDDSSSGNTGSAVFDFEGDGAAEAVYADQTRLWVFSGIDGTVKLESTEHSNGTWLEYPVIADVNGDGHAEIVAVNDAQYGTKTGVTVFGDRDNTWRPGRKIWNQHAYSITNVNDDGTIPAVPEVNWSRYNNFRSGDMTSGDGISAPDLTLAQGDICEADCDDGQLVLWVHAGNEGAVDLRVDATIEVYAVTGGNESLLSSITVPPTLAVGWYNDAVKVVVDASAVRSADRIVMRISSTDLECDESNNSLTWNGPFCQ